MTIREFLDKNRKNIIEDIKALVNIKSVKGDPVPGAPFGEGVRKVQLKAMELCRREGLAVHDADGMISFAHFGSEDKFLGFIAHMDVVPEGDGWDTPPYECTERDGFLVGRGVGDNKASFVFGLYAIKYLKEMKIPLNYGIRLIMGTDEESGMSDVEYYVKHFQEPVFTITPDSDFPVCHGEKGIFEGDLISGELGESHVLNLYGGVASNVVPDRAIAIVAASEEAKLQAVAAKNQGISLSKTGEGIKVEATGVSAHAGTPFKGISAIHVLVSFLKDSGILNEKEIGAADFILSITKDFYGKPLGIDCDDKKFVPLTIISGMIKKEKGAWTANINIRYPTAITPDELESKINAAAKAAGFTVGEARNMPPFYLEPDLPAIQLLSNIYNTLTKSDEKPYVMSGGTYSRKLKNAVAFGPDFPNTKYPAWVGSAHMKNEAINIDDSMLAAEIYTDVLMRLQEIEF